MKEFDLFISHASEDKDNFVRPLVIELEKAGYKVWYDEFTLKLGDSLTERINHGLTNSKFGLVVLSKAFFNKKWTNSELGALFSLQVDNQTFILPIWYKIDKMDIIKTYPLLADKYAVNADKGLKNILVEINKVIQPQKALRESSYLKEAEELYQLKKYEASIIIASKRLEIFLKELAYSKIGKDRIKINSSLKQLLQLLIDNNYLKTKNTNYRLNISMFWQVRNKAVHEPASITAPIAKRYIAFVEELIIKNQ